MRVDFPKYYDSSERAFPALNELIQIVRYRDLVLQLVSRSIKTRYKRSILGVAWTMVNPLLTMAVLTLVFSSIFRASTANYALFVLSGLLVWNFFAQTTSASMGDLIWSGDLVNRIYMPKSAFAVAAIGTGLANFVLALVPFLFISLLLGQAPGLVLLSLPLPILALSMFALGLGLLLSTAAVRFADVIPTYEILLTAWMFLTPVIYPVEALPETVRSILRLNPMIYPLTAVRQILLQGQAPTAEYFVPAMLIGALTLGLGWIVFARQANAITYNV